MAEPQTTQRTNAMKQRARLLLVATTLLSSAAHASPPNLGRLFFSPQTRQLRDTPAPIVKAPATPQVITPLRLDGIVRRNGGPTTVWVNGKAYPQVAPLPHNDTGTAYIRTPNGALRPLKVGEQTQVLSSPP